MKRSTKQASHATTQDAPHQHLIRRRIGTAVLSGALALSMCPAIALAQPWDSNDMQQGGNPPAQQQMQQMQQGDQQTFGGMVNDLFGGQPMFQGEQGGAPSGDMGQAPEQGEQPPAVPEGDAQQGAPADQNGQANQNGEQPPALPEGEANGQNGQQPPAMPGNDNGPGAQFGQALDQNVRQQMMNSPEQVRDIVERVLDAVNLEKTTSLIDDIMGKLGFGAPNGQMGQPGQMGQSGQPGQPGQMDQNGQPGQSGNQNSGQPGQPGNSQNGQPGGMSNAPTSYDAATTLTDSTNGAAYKSTSDSENAVLVDGKAVTISNATVDKTGDSNGESADFYGINAAILANNGATLDITDTTVTTDGAHANGVFSYGSGTTVNISDSTITTSGNNSGGLMTTGGASLNATNLTVSTSGNSSAAIRTDRGGGTVTATQGSYSTSGVGSPAVYSTADITVSDATLSATNSEAVVIEGGNSVTLNNVNATGNNAKLNGQSTVATNVLIYQSMSGDASEGASDFNMTGGSLTSLTGSMFHVTNVTTTINLTGVALTNAADSSDFLIATADAWGTSGKNGGHATVNLSNQVASGNITVDSVSSVALNLMGNSSYSGAIANEGTVNVKVEAGSTWTLTGDSSVTSLDNAGTINLNGYKLYVNGVLYSA